MLELVREAMLDVVDRVGDDRHVRLGVRIELARDLTTLWYLRPIHGHGGHDGETAARESLRNPDASLRAIPVGWQCPAPHALSNPRRWMLVGDGGKREQVVLTRTPKTHRD